MVLWDLLWAGLLVRAEGSKHPRSIGGSNPRFGAGEALSLGPLTFFGVKTQLAGKTSVCRRRDFRLGMRRGEMCMVRTKQKPVTRNINSPIHPSLMGTSTTGSKICTENPEYPKTSGPCVCRKLLTSTSRRARCPHHLASSTIVCSAALLQPAGSHTAVKHTIATG